MKNAKNIKALETAGFFQNNVALIAFRPGKTPMSFADHNQNMPAVHKFVAYSNGCMTVVFNSNLGPEQTCYVFEGENKMAIKGVGNAVWAVQSILSHAGNHVSDND